jgi:hypothetical protein
VHILHATCAQLGVSLTPEGDGIRVRGPRPARDELLPEIRKLKPELLAVLRSLGPPRTSTTVTTTTRQPLPPDGPREQLAYDWRGRPVNLFGLRPGGRSPIFVLPKPEGLH